MDTLGIRRKLERRGVSLNHPATEHDISRLSVFLKGEIDPSFINILHEFDGFLSHDGDPATMYRMWSISEIIGFEDKLVDVGQPIPIGDELIMADFFMFNIRSGGPIFFLEKEQILAESITEFYLKLAEGHFDTEFQ